MSAAEDLSSPDPAIDAVPAPKQKFFESRKAAASLKHAILRRYIVPFASKAGFRSKDHRVVIVDGYAGAGRYEDGQPGSPVLIAEAAHKTELSERSIEGFFVERDRPTYEQLRNVLTAEGGPPFTWEAYPGGVEDHLDRLIEKAAGAALLVFLDPFGRGVPFQTVTSIFTRRKAGISAPATEVLLRFDANDVRRTRGWLAAGPFPGRDAGLRGMDAVVGGGWWRHGDAALDNADYLAWMMREYVRLAKEAISGGGWRIPIRHREGVQPAYYLIFLTRRQEGMTAFGSALSSANEEWRRELSVKTFYEEWTPEEIETYGLTAARQFNESEAALAAEWINQLESNVRNILASTPAFQVSNMYSQVYAGVAGRAREKHLRVALKRLHADGTTSSNGIGKLDSKRIERSS